jgi:ACS family tartrate transporter-like MFS transporter
MSEQQIFTKCAWRLLPILMAANFASLLDRVNAGLAALTMNRDLGFSPSVFGFGAGILFAGYALFQVPSNLALYRIGARRWISVILVSWGLASASCALIRGPLSFYLLRFLVGAAEAGLVPGSLLYLNLWFPKTWLCRANSLFSSANVIALIVGGPLGALLLSLNGAAGIRGWQWLFLIEGLAPVLLGVAVLLVLPDGPESALFLSDQEKTNVAERLRQERVIKQDSLLRALCDARVLMLGLAHGCFSVAGLGLAIWLPQSLQAMGFSNGSTGLLVGLISAAGLPVMYLWGRSSDRSGDRIWHAAMPMLVASGGLTFAAMQPGSALSILALTIASVALQCWLAPFYSLAPLFLSGAGLAGGIALAIGLANLIGGFGGQYAIGVIRQYSGGYAAPFALMATAALTAGLIVLALRRSMATAPMRQPAPAA